MCKTLLGFAHFHRHRRHEPKQQNRTLHLLQKPDIFICYRHGALSPNGADLAIEITRSIESGRVHAEPRSGLNTTPTTLEEFATTTFARAYLSASAPSLSDRVGGQILRSLLFLAGRYRGAA